MKNPKKLSLILMTFLSLFLISNTGFAEDWRDIDFDFDNVNKIYIDTNITYDNSFGGYELMKLKNIELLDTYKKKIDKYEVTERKPLADAVVSTHIKNWKKWQIDVPAEYTTEEAQVKHVDIEGKTHYGKVMTFDLYREGYSYMRSRFEVEFKLTDVKTGKVIYTKTDSCAANESAGTMYSEYDMFEDAVKDFYKDMDKAKWAD